MALKVAIVLGGADTVWTELERALALAPDPVIIATNHAARDYEGRVDHWVSMHAELLPLWTKARAAAGRGKVRSFWIPQHRKVEFPGARLIASRGGSSGMLAVTVAIEHLAMERVMCCGVPMNQNGHHFDDPRRWREASQYLPAWRRYLPAMEGKVKSFSGDTMKLLGAPTEEWLNGGPGPARG